MSKKTIFPKVKYNNKSSANICQRTPEQNRLIVAKKDFFVWSKGYKAS